MNTAMAIQETDPSFDSFPTRNAGAERHIERVDPVVWGTSRNCAYLTDEDRKSYAENGFLIKKDLFSDDEIATLVKTGEELRDARHNAFGGDAIREAGSDALRTLFRLEKHSEIFDRLSRSEKVAGVARSILDDEVYIHQSRLNYKPGFHGKGFYWHSDFETWHAEDGMPRMRALSASILLTDNDDMNGPLMLMPGSHMHFVSCSGETPDNNHETSLVMQDVGIPSEETLTNMAERFGIEAATGKAGAVIFFDCNTMHGSNGNITPFPRSNAFFVFNALSNQLNDPFGAKKPRPDFLARRDTPTALITHDSVIE